jgi:streptogrisin D
MRSRALVRQTALAVTGLALLSLFVTPAAQAVITNADQAAELAASLGDSRTAGVFYDDNDQLVIGVTDEDAAEKVRAEGGTPKLVANSTATLNAVHAEFDQLAGIANTSWGVDVSTNKVSVEVYDGVSAADQARLAALAARHGGAVSIEKLPGTAEPAAYDMRGGVGISSGDRLCSAAFNVANSSGKKYLLTAGHCMVGGHYKWNRDSGNVYLGDKSSFQFEPGDWAVVEYKASNVNALGTIQYRDGSAHQITASRWARNGEAVKRTGTISQDFKGKVLDTSVTVNYSGGVTLYKMIKTNLCVMAGDSGGSLFSGSTALGITSGGTDIHSACSDGVSNRRSFYNPVQRVLVDKGLHVY